MSTDNGDVPCKTDPRAPHGFLRQASHAVDRYVCECEHWQPPSNEATKPTMSPDRNVEAVRDELLQNVQQVARDAGRVPGDSFLRGFGTTFDLQTGRIRNWYVDREGVKRWADDDSEVRDET
jgi:hypothetical protein